MKKRKRVYKFFNTHGVALFLSKAYYLLAFWIPWIGLLCLVVVDEIGSHLIYANLPSPLWPLAFWVAALGCNVLVACFSKVAFFSSVRKKAFLTVASLSIESLLLFVSTSYAFGLLSYALCALNFPFVDQNLNAFDEKIGFRWSAYYLLVDTKALRFIFQSAYESLPFQIGVFTFWFALSGNIKRLYEVFLIVFLASVLTVTLSGFFPALGPIFFQKLQTFESALRPDFLQIVSDIFQMRSHSLASIDWLQGIVTFPSFHTVAALIFIYAFRDQGLMGGIMVSLNGVMLLATPIYGDHYVADLLGGALVALLSIYVVRAWLKASGVEGGRGLRCLPFCP